VIATALALLFLLLFACVAAILRSLLRVAEHVVEDEVKAFLPYAATRMLAQAIEMFPPEMQGERRAEWEAELVSLEGQSLRTIWFARQCLKAACIECKELSAFASGAAPAGSTTAGGVAEAREKQYERRERIRAGLNKMLKD
jgi:hypothetical protein